MYAFLSCRNNNNSESWSTLDNSCAILISIIEFPAPLTVKNPCSISWDRTTDIIRVSITASTTFQTNFRIPIPRVHTFSFGIFTNTLHPSSVRVYPVSQTNWIISTNLIHQVGLGWGGGGQWKSLLDMPHWATSVDFLITVGYDCLHCYSLDILPPPWSLLWLDFHHQCQTGWRNLVWSGQGGTGLPAGTGPRSLPTPSTNMYMRGVTAALMCVGTTSPSLIIPPVDLLVPLLEYPTITQSPTPRPLLCCVYHLSRTFFQTLSEYVPHYDCGLLGGGVLLSRQSSYRTYSAYIVDSVHGWVVV